MLGQKAVDNNSFMFNHANGPYKKGIFFKIIYMYIY